MTVRLISSAANPRFRAWRQLVSVPRAARGGGTLLEGEHLGRAALDAGWPIAAVLLREGQRPAFEDLPGHAPVRAVVARARAQGAAVYAVAAALYDTLAPVERGSGAMFEIAVPTLDLPQRFTTDAMLLDGVQDPGNAGALLRVAAAAGVHWVFATPGTTALWAPKVMRAAMGGHFALNLVEGVAAAPVARRAPDAVWIAADAGQGTALWAAPLDAPQVGWVFGAEGAGLSAAAAAICSLRVRIPLAPRIESLNVVTAAAVCLFERRRQAGAAAAKQ